MAVVVRILRDESVDLPKPLPFKNAIQLYTEIDEEEENILTKSFPRSRILDLKEAHPKWRVCNCSYHTMECGHSHNAEILEETLKEAKLAQELGIFDHIELWENSLHKRAAAILVGVVSNEFEAPKYFLIVAFGDEEYLNKVNEKAREKKRGLGFKMAVTLAGIFSLLWLISPIAGGTTIYRQKQENDNLRNEIAHLNFHLNAQIEPMLMNGLTIRALLNSPDCSKHCEQWGFPLPLDWSFYSETLGECDKAKTLKEKFPDIKSARIVVKFNLEVDGIIFDRAAFIECTLNDGTIYEAVPYVYLSPIGDDPVWILGFRKMTGKSG